MQTLSQIVEMVRAAQNPNEAINQLAANNPQLKEVIQYVNQNGGNAKAAFYKLAQERGVNPDDILNQLKLV